MSGQSGQFPVADGSVGSLGTTNAKHQNIKLQETGKQMNKTVFSKTKLLDLESLSLRQSVFLDCEVPSAEWFSLVRSGRYPHFGD